VQKSGNFAKIGHFRQSYHEDPQDILHRDFNFYEDITRFLIFHEDNTFFTTFIPYYFYHPFCLLRVPDLYFVQALSAPIFGILLIYIYILYYILLMCGWVGRVAYVLVKNISFTGTEYVTDEMHLLVIDCKD